MPLNTLTGISDGSGRSGSFFGMTYPLKNPVAVWDFTLAAGDDWTEARVREFLTPDRVKRWCFQFERGEETGYLHFQGRVSLVTKRRSPPTWLVGAHWSATSVSAKDEEFYVTKEDTRVAGPWTDRDPPPPFLDDDVRAVMHTLRPWQQEVLDSFPVREYRAINILVDATGGIGKSTIKDVARFRGLATVLTFMTDHKDMMRQAMDKPKVGGYIIDLPRAVPKTHLNQLFAAIESLKDGYAYDDRYKYREEYFAKPVIWVFSNVRPDATLLSQDRWRFWSVSGDSLEPLDP